VGETEIVHRHDAVPAVVFTPACREFEQSCIRSHDPPSRVIHFTLLPAWRPKARYDRSQLGQRD
jgi:hypothetical protein